ncbi:unnamed protein product [Cyclocybe aegerita]|uniref:RNA helicase n=1 Tax=Cyclocybe aegerita TaxID=1973307 RepID=A0A8S0W3W9_CYCAE|nr:unnamed protein product [Cyclocybe aegerita]
MQITVYTPTAIRAGILLTNNTNLYLEAQENARLLSAMAGPPVRSAFNAKARQSLAGSRKKGKAKNSVAKAEEPQPNSNADILIPKSKEEKHNDRKEKLLQELAAQSELNWNTKKKKRLEKYIDKKLKKEERVLIFEKLAKTQASLSSSLLQSSSTLGTGKALTHKELQEKAEDSLVKKSLLGQPGKRKRHQDVFDIQEADDEDEELSPDEDDEVPDHHNVDSTPLELPSETSVVIDESPSLPPAKSAATVGSALQRNLDGSTVAPKVRPRTKGMQTQRGWGKKTPVEVQPDSDTSFDSSDSENDPAEQAEGSSLDPGSEDNEDDEMQIDDSKADSDSLHPVKKKSLGFKDWAIKQLSVAKGYDLAKPTDETSVVETPRQPPRKRQKVDDDGIKHGPLGEELQLPSTSFSKHLLDSGKKSGPGAYSKAVEVKRPADVEEARILLPIVTEEQPIMEAILLNPVIIICGETGSGKTTQVPQFLYEAGFGTPGSGNPGMIGITQPRRVAAMSMAARVAHELSLTSSRVSYQIRYDATVSPETSIKFMTDGVLLRELATDFLLTKYSIIIIDEAHERSINTDILIGVLSRVIKLREELWNKGKDGIKPLRLIIMSATLRVSDFAENKTLFASPPPVIHVAARQHPVTIHFSRRTHPDYVTQAVKKTVKIHTCLPPGGILIFLTGQNEITGVCKRLEAKFGNRAISEKKRRRNASQSWSSAPQGDLDSSGALIGAVLAFQADVEVEEIDLDTTGQNDPTFGVDESLSGDEDSEALDSDGENQLEEELRLDDDSDVPMHVVPLYSLLPSEKQMQVFQQPPSGSRLVVVSTNVAETSLTIPGIRYVVDCGRAKERHYDAVNGIQRFQISWVSKASAAQRAGRAGRIGPGHCYRLYSSALFEHHFENFSTPEIQRMPIDGIVLQMKSMHIDAVVNFPFPTPPDRSALHKAEKCLVVLGALSPLPTSTERQITDLGRAMSLFPLSPRFSRMLVTGQQHGCLPYIICIVSALSVGDPFVYEEALDQESDREESDVPITFALSSEATIAKERRRLLRKAFFQSQHTHASLGKYTSDMFRVLSVVGAYEYAGGGQKFCAEQFVRPKAMEEIHKLRAQISNIVHANFPTTDPNFIPRLPPPNDRQLKALRQILTAGFLDQVAIRKDLVDSSEASGNKYATSKGVAYRALGVSEDVYIHPSSILFNSSPPDYLVYHEIVRTTRIFLKGLTVINAAWLSSLGGNTLCTFSKPIKNNVGTLMTIPRFGPEGWELPAVKASADMI